MPDIPLLPASTSYAEASMYLSSNTPFIIKHLASTWPASTDWSIDHSSCPCPNWAYLLDTYGQEKVSVVNCNHEGDAAQPQEMVFSDVIKLWKDGNAKGLYIKDWHLPRNITTRQAQKDDKGKNEPFFYETPDVFKDDWMNHYYSHKTEDDFKFVYFGTQGTTTSLHRDVCEFLLAL
jgi:hypothetical protein